MELEVGTRVVAESESVDRPPRSGTVEEVVQAAPHPRYRIRWDDGRETIYTPEAGALHPEGEAPGPTRSRRGEA